MVMKGVIKGILMFIFCVVYAVFMFIVFKLVEMIETRLGLNKVAFSAWNSKADADLEDKDKDGVISDSGTEKAMGELTHRIHESRSAQSVSFYN